MRDTMVVKGTAGPGADAKLLLVLGKLRHNSKKGINTRYVSEYAKGTGLGGKI